jgi:hypothetical protein
MCPMCLCGGPPQRLLLNIFEGAKIERKVDCFMPKFPLTFAKSRYI